MKYRCPVCKKIIRDRGRKQEFFPFCSPRCKLVDLGSWLNSEYKIVSKPADKDGHQKAAE